MAKDESEEQRQGLSSHTAQATMAKYYDMERGKALSISSLGYPLGEALLPSLIAGLLAYLHWRATWGIIALVIVLFFIPTLWMLIRREKTVVRDDEESGKAESAKESYQKILSDKRSE